MAWRFKASKYKNAAPLAAKFEHQVRGLSVGCYLCHGNLMSASAAFMAFNWDSTGSSLAVLPLDARGQQSRAAVPLLHAHTDLVTDFQFSPFDDGLLATGSQDQMVGPSTIFHVSMPHIGFIQIKLWRIPEKGLDPADTQISPEMTMPRQPRRIETINFHPAADCVLATAAGETLTVWDVIEGKELFTCSVSYTLSLKI